MRLRRRAKYIDLLLSSKILNGLLGFYVLSVNVYKDAMSCSSFHFNVQTKTHLKNLS